MSDRVDEADLHSQEDCHTDEPSTAIATTADGEIIDLPSEAKTVMSPAQAKSAAVSHLMGKAIERASELRLTPEETKALKADFPDECFRSGASGKEALIYIEGLHLRNRLDDVLGIGQWCLLPRCRWTEANGKGTIVYVEAMLVVRGCYITEAIGDMTYYPSNAQTNFGDAVEGAESAALRRCAKKMGIGLQAWSKSWCEGWWKRKNELAKTPEAKPRTNTAPQAAKPQSPPTTQPPAKPAAQASPQTAAQTEQADKPLTEEEKSWIKSIRIDALNGHDELCRVWKEILTDEQKKVIRPVWGELKNIALEADAKRQDPANRQTVKTGA